MLRVIESEPQIQINDAIDRVVQASIGAELTALDAGWVKNELVQISKRYKRQGVINPRWLAEQHQQKPHFFLINAGPGWLDTVKPSVEDSNSATSQYILYGDWDALLILYGTDAEAKKQLEIISGMLDDEPQYFSATNVPLIYRHMSRKIAADLEVERKVVNGVAQGYDEESWAADRQTLETAGVILGPVWMPNTLPSERIHAFTGINVKGRSKLRGDDLLRALLEQDILQSTLVHLFEVDQGWPFHFYAKLVCQSMGELDMATNAIGSTQVGPIRVGGSTVVVANGVDQLPLYRDATPITIGVRPVVDDIQYLAKELVKDVSDEAIANFNNFSSERKLLVLRSLQRVSHAVEIGMWDIQWSAQLVKAVKDFQHQVLDPDIPGRLTGPIMETATAVEGAVKNAIRGLIDEVFMGDYKTAQNEMKLPTKDISHLSLGKAAEALSTAAKDPRFSKYSTGLSEDKLKRLQEFSNYRNYWAHGEPPWKSKFDIIEYASRTIAYGLAIATWTAQELPLPTSPKSEDPESDKKEPIISLPENPIGRESGSFISYSNDDKEIATRIANALRATSHQVWYDDWEVGPGDSIVQKIEDGLAKNDTLIILISPASVQSKWVKLELSNALMRQLNGQDVKIVPILIKEAEFPEALKDIHYIDFTQDFQVGIIELIQFLAKRRTGE